MMTILSDLYDQCTSCNMEVVKNDLTDGMCRWCRPYLNWADFPLADENNDREV